MLWQEGYVNHLLLFLVHFPHVQEAVKRLVAQEKKSLSDKTKAPEHKSCQMWEYNPVENKIISLS